MKGIDFMNNNHWKAFREFCMWLLSWSGDSTLSLSWDCEKATGSICISYTKLNSRQRGLLDRELDKLDKFDDITIGMTDTHYDVYCKGY